jgi:hypothetical protein
VVLGLIPIHDLVYSIRSDVFQSQNGMLARPSTPFFGKYEGFAEIQKALSGDGHGKIAGTCEPTLLLP